MKVMTHPFNRDPGQNLIDEKTTRLIIGSFPSHELTPYQGNAVIDYYYGNASRFWKIIGRSHDLGNDFANDIDSIKKFLRDNQTGIIDMIYKCYRLNDTSSLDSDLSIIEMEDIPGLLRDYPGIDTIYTTSHYARDLLISRQLRPFIKHHHIKAMVDSNHRAYEELSILDRNIRLYRLGSPSGRAGYTDDELLKDYSLI